MTGRRPYAYHTGGPRFREYYRNSVIRNEFRRDEHGRFVNHGVGRERMEHATHGRVEQAHLEVRNAVGNREVLAKERQQQVRQPGGHGDGPAVKPPAPVSKAYIPPAPTKSPPISGGGKKK